MSAFTTIPPPSTGKQSFLVSPYLTSPFASAAPSTPLPHNQSPTPTNAALHMLNTRTDDEVFDLAYHPTLPLFVAGLITGELQLYRMDGRLEQQQQQCKIKSNGSGTSTLKPVKEEGEAGEEAEEVGEGSSFEDDDQDEEVVLKPSYLAAPSLLSTSCPHTASIRSIAFSADGSRLYTASSDQSISTFALTDSELRQVDSTPQAHGCAINVVKVGSGDRDGMLASGDDDGYVKVWDTRTHNQGKHSHAQRSQHTANVGASGGKGQKRKRRKTGKATELKAASASASTAAMSFAESGDYISDLLMSDSHLLLSSSGDGHLQVFDLRRAGSWYAQSEAVDDDLLSLCCVVKQRGKGSVERRRKVLVGSKESGVHVYSWDWFGRPDEHFAYADSADCIVALDTPATTANVIAIGSSEGTIALCTLWPHTLHRTIGKHAGGQPVEAVRLSGRVKVAGVAGSGGGGWVGGSEDGGERDSRWLVSAGHDKRIRFWDVTSVCEAGIDKEQEEEEEEEKDEDDEDEDEDEGAEEAEEEADEMVTEEGQDEDVEVNQTAAEGESEVEEEEEASTEPSAVEDESSVASSKPAAVRSGGVDRATAVAALKRKIAAAKQQKAAQGRAAGRTADSSSDDDDDDSDADERPRKGGKGAQQSKRPVMQQQQKKKKVAGNKVKGFFDGL